jgi:hypothetical protein
MGSFDVGKASLRISPHSGPASMQNEAAPNLQESEISYSTDSTAENSDVSPENTYYWEVFDCITTQ